MEKKVAHGFTKGWHLFLVGFGVFFTSMVILSLESLLNRMFAATFWYHFAFVVLSIALFGIGVGGMLVYFTPAFVRRFTPGVIALLAVIFAFVMPWVIQTINAIPLSMKAVETSAEHQAYFVRFFLLLSLPFLMAGYVFSLVFTYFREKITLLYFFDLLGGGIGVVVMLLFFPHHGPFVLVWWLGLLMIIVGVLFLLSVQWVAGTFLLLAIPLYIVVFEDYTKTEIRISSEKKDVTAVGKVIQKEWDSFGYVVMVEKTQGGKFITADFTCYTYFFSPREDVREYRGITPVHNYPYVIKENPENVGIVGVGAGKDVLVAIGFGAKRIYGAEFNTTIHRWFKEYYAKEFAPGGQFSNVFVEREEGRFFLRRSPRKYDVLVFDNSISQVALSSGSFTLAESYLFTVEAMMDYYLHLADGGVVYLSNPLPHAMRFVSLWKEAFRRMGISSQLKRSLIVYAEQNPSYPKCKILVKRGGFTSAEIERIKAYAASLGHVPLYVPNHHEEGEVAQFVLTDDANRFYRRSDQELRPSTDNWPFFSQHVRGDMDHLTSEVLQFRFYYPQPFVMLKQMTKMVVFSALMFLLVPLLLLNIGGLRKLPNKGGTILYFVALGLGFMLVENVLIQKYILVLGHPAYSFTLVLAALLISAGIGSLFSERISNPYQAALVGCLGIVGGVLVVMGVLSFLDTWIVGLSFFGRVVVAILLVSLNGFFMGMMMPSGIRAIEKHERAIPWMWAVNGIFSIAANFVSIYLSVMYGFWVTLGVGIGLYVLGTFFFVFRFKLRHSD
ncbi:MAG: alkaline shock response membrane anchor protein AmaP [Brevinematales bacterium]|nr:alkaline shock response membrane anchor protein AmaP [Brevinematales bacterium]